MVQGHEQGQGKHRHRRRRRRIPACAPGERAVLAGCRTSRGGLPQRRQFTALPVKEPPHLVRMRGSCRMACTRSTKSGSSTKPLPTQNAPRSTMAWCFSGRCAGERSWGFGSTSTRAHVVTRTDMLSPHRAAQAEMRSQFHHKNALLLVGCGAAILRADRSSAGSTARQAVRRVLAVRPVPTVFRGDNALSPWYTADMVAAGAHRGARNRASNARRKVIGEEGCAEPDANL
jgi:hypothetical protein